MVSVPRVMISSTLYDLRQVRADLTRFLEDDMGCVPLASELTSFPVEPDLDTVENCRRRAEEDADILVLIMGGRYGSVDLSSARSVTNLEYLAARTKGIPIYAFVTKDVLALLPFWKENPKADFSIAVDDTRVFEFIKQVREEDAVWTQEFELVEHIISGLRPQLARLMTEGLRFIQRRRDEPTFRTLAELSGSPLRIALEKPAAWQYKLFAELLNQEIISTRALRLGHRLGIAYGTYQWVPFREIDAWGRSRLVEIEALLNAMTTIMDKELREAWGDLGEPGDLDMIVFCARELGQIYREAIDWSLRVRRSTGEASFVHLADTMRVFVDDIVGKIEGFGPLVLSEVEDLLAAVARGEDPVRTMRLSIDLPGAEAFREALQGLMEELNRVRS